MNFVYMTYDELKNEINRRIREIHQQDKRKRVSSGRVIELQVNYDAVGDECNWDANYFMNISEYQDQVLAVVRELKTSHRLVEELTN